MENIEKFYCECKKKYHFFNHGDGVKCGVCNLPLREEDIKEHLDSGRKEESPEQIKIDQPLERIPEETKKRYVLKRDCPNIRKEIGDYYCGEYGESIEELLENGTIELEVLETPTNGEETKSQSGEREELKKKIKNAMGDVMIKVSSSDSAVFNGMEFHNPDPVESLLELFLKELSESKKEGMKNFIDELLSEDNEFWRWRTTKKRKIANYLEIPQEWLIARKKKLV